MLLSISIEEYKKEGDRANSFENRAGLFVSAIVAIISIYLQVIPFSKLDLGFNNESKRIIISTTIFVGLLFIALILMVISITYLARVLISRPYSRVDFSNLENIDNNKCDEDIMEYAMVQHYNTILLYNVEINNKKSKLYTKGMIFTVISFMIMLIATIGLLVIL